VTARDDAITIEALAAEVGMTVRNLREWRTLGLLPAAEMRGRVGFYDPAIVERVKVIRQLHAEGFTLELIRRMLEAGGDDVLRFANALRAPLREAPPPPFEPELWGPTASEDLPRAIELGLVRERPDGRLEFTSARAAGVGASLRALGLSPRQILETTAAVREHADALAALFEAVWREHVWEPHLKDGEPQEVEARLGQMQPLALDAVTAIFTIALQARIESAIAAEYREP
jgi:DNA-binding transcriptional MerR regulator